MSICHVCKESFQGNIHLDCKGHTNPPAVLSMVMGNLEPFLAARDLAALALTSTGLQQSVLGSQRPMGLSASREMWNHNGANREIIKWARIGLRDGLPSAEPVGKPFDDFIGEGVVARLLRAAFSQSYRPWDILTEAERAPYRTKFNTANFTAADLTPDFVITKDGVHRVADCFSVTFPWRTKQTNVEGKAAEIVMNMTKPQKGAQAKWNKYGAESVAVANLVGFPDVISTAQIINWISQGAPQMARYAQKDNVLFIVRDPIFFEFKIG